MTSVADVRAAGLEAWPGIEVGDDQLAAYLAARAQATAEPADLYLACACELGVPRAADAFARVYLGPIASYLGTLARTVDVDEVRQILALRLVIGDREPPRIREYRGRGALGGWVRIAAVRVALDLARRTAPEQVDDMLVELAVDGDPELELMRQRYAQHFGEGFREAVAAVPPAERALLRLHYLEGMTLPAMATLYRVSRPTMVRRLAEARTHVFEATAEIVKRRLQLSTADYEILLGAIRANQELTLERLMLE